MRTVGSPSSARAAHGNAYVVRLTSSLIAKSVTAPMTAPVAETTRWPPHTIITSPKELSVGALVRVAPRDCRSANTPGPGPTSPANHLEEVAGKPPGEPALLQEPAGLEHAHESVETEAALVRAEAEARLRLGGRAALLDPDPAVGDEAGPAGAVERDRHRGLEVRRLVELLMGARRELGRLGKAHPGGAASPVLADGETTARAYICRGVLQARGREARVRLGGAGVEQRQLEPGPPVANLEIRREGRRPHGWEVRAREREPQTRAGGQAERDRRELEFDLNGAATDKRLSAVE